MTLGIEGKGYAPDLITPRKPELLHVRIMRGLGRSDRGPPQVRAELRQQFRVRQQFILQVLCQGGELAVEVIVKQYGPV